MFINKEGKFFNKFSIIDLLVILAIIVAALGVYSRFGTTTKVVTETQSIEYTILVKGVREGTVEALSKPSPITNTTTKEYAGDIVSATYTEAIEGKELPNGSLAAMTIPERYDVTVTVRIDGKANESGFYTPTNQAITTGSTLMFSSKYAITSGTITSVKEVK